MSGRPSDDPRAPSKRHHERRALKACPGCGRLYLSVKNHLAKSRTCPHGKYCRGVVA